MACYVTLYRITNGPIIASGLLCFLSNPPIYLKSETRVHPSGDQTASGGGSKPSIYLTYCIIRPLFVDNFHLYIYLYGRSLTEMGYFL